MCRQFILSSAGVIAVAGSALAAEPLPPPPPFTWSGVYVGGQIGWASITDNVSLTGTANDLDPVAAKYSLGPQGVIGGAHVGYNLQPVTPAWSWLVFGIEASVDGTSLRKTANVPLADFAFDTFGSMAASSNLGVQGSVRGRLGIAWDRLLLFGEGGVAVTSFDTTYFDTTGFFTGVPGTSATISNTRAGFTFGGGLEYAVTDNWSVRAEYRHSNFGNVSDFPFANPNNFVLPLGGFVVAQHYLIENQVQFGVSYRFDMMVPPPPSAAVPPGGPAAPPGPPGSPYALPAAPPAQPVAAR